VIELVVGLVAGVLLSAGLLVLGFQTGWKLRDRAGVARGEARIGPIVETVLDDPIVLNGFEAVDDPEGD
jgi:hypothetical protein